MSLKQNQKEHDMQEQPEPKNIQVASTSGGHTLTDIDLKVLNFVQEKGKRYSISYNTFKLQWTITNALRYKFDPSGNVVK